MPRRKFVSGPAGPLLNDVWQHLRNRDQRPRPSRFDAEGKATAVNAAGRGLKIGNAAKGSVRIDLMDEIGYWGVTAQDFVDELLAIDATTIELHVNSPGGDVFDGVAIMNALADHPATVNVVVDGLAASAASFIAMAGDSVKMNRASQMMIHDATGLAIGNAADMTDMATLLNRISDTIAGIYAERAGQDNQDAAFWRNQMRTETWYSAAEAVTAGLADEAMPMPDPDMPDEPDPDEPAEPDEKAAARTTGGWDLAKTSFMYAGRAAAPAPALKTPGMQPAATLQIDPADFKRFIKEGISS